MVRNIAKVRTILKVFLFELNNNMIFEALSSLQAPAANGAVECRACQRGCVLQEGAVGYCSGYTVENGKLLDLTHGNVTPVQVTEVGWAPISRYGNPTDPWLSVGSVGCNMRCGHCVNRSHAFARHAKKENPDPVSPDVLVEYARAMGCHGILGNFNEASIAAAMWYDVFRQAKESGLSTGLVTNGYSTAEALDVLCPHLDVYRCDIKAYTPKVMRRQGNGGVNPQGVLRSLRHVHDMHPHVHIETVTMIAPGINDSEHEIRNIAHWLRDNLGPETPWHISPMDYVSVGGVYARPDYVRPTDLMTETTVRGVSLEFSDEVIQLPVGSFDLIPLQGPKHTSFENLERIRDIGVSCGLQDVIVKTDGH